MSGKFGGYLVKGKPEKAIEYFEEGKSILECHNIRGQTLTICYYKLGEACWLLKKYDKALTYYNRALDEANRTWSETSHPNIQQIFYSLGCIHVNLNNFIETESYFKKFLDQLNLLNDKENICIAKADNLDSLGLIAFRTNNYNMAGYFFKKSLEIRIVNDTIHESNSALARTYQNVAFIYKHSNKMGKAIHYYGKALQRYEKIDKENVFSLEKNECASHLADLYTKIGFIRIAKNFVDMSQKFMIHIHSNNKQNSERTIAFQK